MALNLSFDGVAEFIARQVYGNTEDDSLDMANLALDLALQEVAATSKLINQEAEGTLALTGAGSYDLSDIDVKLLRVVEAWTTYGKTPVMRKAEFVSRYPNHAEYPSGIPRHVVLWGQDSLMVWPDQADMTLNVLYYKLLEQEHAGEILFALRNLGMKYAESDKDTRAINFQIGENSIVKLQKVQTRAQDMPVRFLPENRVNIVNRHKRNRRWPRY